MDGKASKRDLRRYWPRLLFVIPVGGVLWVSLYNRAEPKLFGVPFYYWFQLSLVLLGAAIVLAVYALERSSTSED